MINALVTCLTLNRLPKSDVKTKIRTTEGQDNSEGHIENFFVLKLSSLNTVLGLIL